MILRVSLYGELKFTFVPIGLPRPDTKWIMARRNVLCSGVDISVMNAAIPMLRLEYKNILSKMGASFLCSGIFPRQNYGGYSTCRWCSLQRVRQADWRRRGGILWAMTWSGRWGAWTSPPQVWKDPCIVLFTHHSIRKIKAHIPDEEVEIKEPLASERVAPRPEEERGDDWEEMVDYALVNSKLSHSILRMSNI